jgi:hypothetical protein
MGEKLVVARERWFFRPKEKTGRGLQHAEVCLLQTRLQQISEQEFGRRCKF